MMKVFIYIYEGTSTDILQDIFYKYAKKNNNPFLMLRQLGWQILRR